MAQSFIDTSKTTSSNSVTGTQHTHPTITYNLVIYKDKDNMYQCEPCDKVTLTRARHCAPAKLQFRIPKDSVLNFTEGDRVQFSVNDTVVFLGFVFEKSHSKDNVISVTAYDQLRYFKNKECYAANKKTANEILEELCTSYGLTYADGKNGMANTALKISWLFDEKTLADIVDFSLGYTTLFGSGHPVFECYDDAGKIKISNCNSPDMTLDIILDGDTVGDYDYTTSIDKNTYDMVKIVREAPADNNRSTMVKTGEVQDKEHIQQWGRLQYLIKADSNNMTPIEQAKRYLSLHDAKTREIHLRGCIGDVRVRGGSKVYVNLNFGDIKVSNYLFVNGVTHTFEQNLHLMDIDLDYVEQAGAYEVTYDNDAAILSKIKAAENKRYSSSGTYSQSEQGAYSKMKALGASDGQAAGILGNVRHEDISYDPAATNGTHTGLFQLDNDDRWAKYEQWCKQTGNDPYCNDNQIEYVTTVENGNLFTGENCPYGAMPDDPAEAAKWFNDHIEVSKTSASMGGDSSERIASANDVYNSITSGEIGVESLTYPTIYHAASGADPSLLQAGVDAVVNSGNNYFGEDGCVKAATELGSYYNTDLADAVNDNVVSVSGLESYMEARGYTVQAYDGTAAPGDIIIWSDAHVGVADGAGGCYANETGAGHRMVYVPDVNYGWQNNVPPSYVIHL